MFGKSSPESSAGNRLENKEINSVEKAARVLSINEKVKSLANRYKELQLGLTTDDAVLLDKVAMELRDIFKAKNIKLGIDEANNADIKAFIESFEHALEQNTGR